MTENILINKNLSFFIFLGELADVRQNPWHKERKKEWTQIVGLFTKEEKHLLFLFKQIFNSISYDYVESFFILKNPLKNKELNKILGRKNKLVIEKLFNIFLDKFEIVWKINEKNLIHLRNELSTSRKKRDALTSRIFNICGVYKNNQIPIHLVISSSSSEDELGWYSVNKLRTSLGIECSHKLTAEKIKFINLILLHEIFHFAINRNKSIKKIIKEEASHFHKKLKDIAPYTNSIHILEELIISSFVPEGYISKLFSYKKTSITKTKRVKGFKNNLLSARRYVGENMHIYAKEYIEKNKRIDKIYITNLISII